MNAIFKKRPRSQDERFTDIDQIPRYTPFVWRFKDEDDWFPHVYVKTSGDGKPNDVINLSDGERTFFSKNDCKNRVFALIEDVEITRLIEFKD